MSSEDPNIFGSADLLVEEYLRYRSMRRALAAFVTERAAVAQARQPAPIANPGDVLQRVLNAFDKGDYPRLLTLWDQYIVRPMEIAGREDREMRAVEFYFNVHCATYAFRKEGLATFKTPKIAARTAARTMTIFKHYIESRGRRILKLPEFSPYKELPEVEFPPQHAAFQHVFMPEWVTMIRERMRRFLLFYMKSTETPKLIQLAQSGGSMELAALTSTSITSSVEFNMNEREEKLKKTFRKRERKVRDICSAMQKMVTELLRELEADQDSPKNRKLAASYRNKFQDILDEFDGDSVGLSFAAADFQRSLASFTENQSEESPDTASQPNPKPNGAVVESSADKHVTQAEVPSTSNAAGDEDVLQGSVKSMRNNEEQDAPNSRSTTTAVPVPQTSQALQSPIIHVAELKMALNDKMARLVEYITVNMKETTEPLPHDGCDAIERRATDLSLLLQAATPLFSDNTDANENAEMLINSGVKLDMLSVRGALNLVSSAMTICGFVITNPNALLYCEESGRHRRIVRSVNVLVDYMARMVTSVASTPAGLAYCTSSDTLATDLFESLSWEIDEYATIDEVCRRTESQRLCSCLIALSKLAAETGVQRALVTRGIVPWLVAKIQQHTGLHLIDVTESSELLSTARQITQGPLVGAALELLQYLTATSETTMLLLKSTSGLIIIADLVLVLIVLTVSTHADLATNAQVCLRNLCAEKDVRQLLIDRSAQQHLDNLLETGQLNAGQTNIVQSIADMLSTGDPPEWSLDPIVTGWQLPEDKLLETYAKQHDLATGTALLERLKIYS